MKTAVSKRLFIMFLALAMVMGMGLLAAPLVSAESEAVTIYASNLSDDTLLRLSDDTVLAMDVDRRLSAIIGEDFDLTIEGSGKLTVNGDGNGIAVKSLHCTSDLFVQPGWHAIDVIQTVYIDNAESFIVGGIYAGGHIDIQCDNATIGGNDNAIFSSLGNITLSGGTFDIGANGVAVYAETGNINMTGAFTVNSNNDRTIHAGMGELVIEGSLKSTSGAQFDPDVPYINRDFYSIGATGGVNFYGTTLEVTGLGGIRGGGINADSDISITADSVSIITERYYALNGENIYVDSDELWLENEGSEENEDVIGDYATIYADKDVTLSSESGGIVGEVALTVFGTLSLNGNFVVGGDPDHDNPLVITNRMEATGTLVLRNDTGLAVDATESFSFNGTTLDIEGYGGIVADGDVNITADNVSVFTQKLSCIEGQTVYIDCGVLRLENEPDVNDPEVGQYGIACYESATVNCPDATIITCDHGVYGNGCDVTLNGNFIILGKGNFGKGIWASNLYLDGGQFTVSSNILQAIDAGRVEVTGNLSLSTEGEENCVTAQEFVFDGTTLTANGYSGIVAGNIDITADSAMIITSAYGVYSETGNITLNGNFTVSAQINAVRATNGTITMTGAITAQNTNEYEYVIYAMGDISFTGTTLNVTGDYGISSAEGDISIVADSTTVITDVGAPIKTYVFTFGDYIGAEGGSVYIDSDYLYLQNKMEYEDHPLATWDGIMAGTDVIVYSNDATIVGKHGISAIGDVHLVGNFNIVGVLGYGAVSDEGSMGLYGNFNIISIEMAGIYAPDLFMNGTFSVTGATKGIECNNLSYTGNGLEVSGETGIHAVESVDLDGDDIRITSSGTRSSGIWCEGDITLAGAVFIRTNGWYGVNGEGNVNLYEGCFDIAGPKGDAQVIKVGGELYMDESLSFIAPSGAHLRGTDICDAVGFPAKEVLIGKLISEISVNVNTPVAGKEPIRYSGQVYNLPLGSSVRWLRWYKNGEPWDVSSGNACFEAGNSYRLEIDLVTCNGYYFADPLTSAAINYQTAEVSTPSGLPAYEIVLSLDFGECPAVVYNVELTIDTPREQNFPDRSVTCGSSIYEQALVGDNMFDTPLQWQKSEDGTTWSTMDLNETFAVGYYYRVFIDIMPANGYRFAIDPQIEPDVSAKVNGFRAEVTRYPEEDPEELISVCYNFGLLNHSIIQQIDIDGVTEPVVGEHPDYGCAISGTGYSINTAYSNGTYVINGLCWRDITDDKWMYPGDTFEIGHEYRVFIDVKTDDGYEFDTEQVGSSYVPTGWGYINDNYATLGIQSDGRFEQSLSWTFTCERKTVKSVAVGGLDVPVQGAMPDYDAVADLAYYTVDSVTWFDYTTGLDMTDSDTFVDGHEYWVLVTVVPNEIEGSKLCRFVPDKTVALLNGIEVRKDRNKHWQEVESAVNFVRIYYTYICGEEEPIVIRVQPASRMVTGGQTAKFSVTAIGDGLTYQWEYRPDANTDWSDSGASGNKTATLSISGAKHRNGFEYRCKITDAYGNVRYTEAAKLTVTTSIVVTQQPVSVTVAAGEKATVTVDASGDNLSYAWYYRDGGSGAFKLTTSFTGNSYSVTMNASRSGRQVYCVITDDNGFSAQTATVTLGMKATIITQPKSASVKSKETITVSLEAAGDGLTYTWYYSDDGGLNFKKTTSFTGNSYSITMTGDRAGRKVYCVVTDKFGNSVTSKTVTLGMRGTAAIRAQPVSVTVANGETAKVAVRASGTGLTYEWYYSDNGGLSFSKTTAFTGNSYSIKMTSARAGRQVYCVVTDKNGNCVKSEVVTLGMTGKAAIHTQPVSVTVANGETAMIAVRASGTGLTYEWYYSDNGGLSFYKTTAFTGSTYSVPMGAKRAGRQVYCVVTDKNGNSVQTDTVTLGMTGKATIHTQPVSVTVANGETAMIAVRASGTGLTYEWYYSDNGGKKYYKTTAFTGSSYYVPMNASRAGRMVYCVITDANGNKVTTDVVTLNMG